MTQLPKSQTGLKWEQDITHPAQVYPEWSVQPSTDSIKAVVAQILGKISTSTIDICFLAEGSFNKVYEVYDIESDKHYAIRLSLPVEPYYKTSSEVATLNYLRETTSLPVPRVVAYDETSDNLVGFEWVLMSFVPGSTLRALWFTLSIEEKRRIVAKIAGFQSELFGHQFSGMGSSRSAGNGIYEVGRMVSISFWWYKRRLDLLYRGPFDTARDWMRTDLQLMINEARQCYEQDLSDLKEERAQKQLCRQSWTPAGFPDLQGSLNGDELMEEEENDDKEESDFGDIVNVIKRLLSQLPAIHADIPEPTTDESMRELTMLCHTDLSYNNILVDPQTKDITGIIEWEHSAVLPLGIACDIPKFLGPEEQPRHKKPKPEEYGECGDYDTNFNGEIDGKSDLYHEALIEYNQTQLRAYFLKVMEEICPEWIMEYHKGSELRDVDEIVARADTLLTARSTWVWLNWFEAGQKKTIAWIDWGHNLELEHDDIGDVQS